MIRVIIPYHLRTLAQAGESRPGAGNHLGGDHLASGGQGNSSGQVGSPGNGGMGHAGIGNGGNAGKQEPLNHAGRDELLRGQNDPKGSQTSSAYSSSVPVKLSGEY